MNRFVVACALVGIVAASGCGNGSDFASADSDGDGAISMEEAASGLKMNNEQFKSADTDGSGSLDASEFQVARAR